MVLRFIRQSWSDGYRSGLQCTIGRIIISRSRNILFSSRISKWPSDRHLFSTRTERSSSFSLIKLTLNFVCSRLGLITIIFNSHILLTISERSCSFSTSCRDLVIGVTAASVIIYSDLLYLKRSALGKENFCFEELLFRLWLDKSSVFELRDKLLSSDICLIIIFFILLLRSAKKKSPRRLTLFFSLEYFFFFF